MWIVKVAVIINVPSVSLDSIDPKIINLVLNAKMDAICVMRNSAYNAMEEIYISKTQINLHNVLNVVINSINVWNVVSFNALNVNLVF